MRTFAIATIFLLAAAAPVLAAPSKPVYEVDTVDAAIRNGKLIVHVTGMVRSGGWENPKLLRVFKGKADTIVLRFVAAPPAPDVMVIEAILPVEATLELPAPRTNYTKVKVIAETNDLIANIK